MAAAQEAARAGRESGLRAEPRGRTPPVRALAGMLSDTMSLFRARVRNGRIVLDEPTDLPEGSVIDLVPADSWDALDDADRRDLHDAISQSVEDVAQGRTVAYDDVLKKLREHR